MALFTPPRSPDMNTRTGLAPRTLPVHLMEVCFDDLVFMFKNKHDALHSAHTWYMYLFRMKCSITNEAKHLCTSPRSKNFAEFFFNDGPVG